MKIIAVANQKGGCGKTITAVNLAGALAGMDKKVLFIDLDPQAHATLSLGIKLGESSESIYTLFDAFLKEDKAQIQALMHQRYKNLWVIGSHISLSTMEQKMMGVKDAIMALSKILKDGQPSEFDYVLIDTPPNLGFLTLNAMHAAEQMLVPLDVSLFSLNGVSQINQILDISGSMGFKSPRLHFLITLFDRRTKFAKEFLNKANLHFDDRLFKTLIRPNVRLREAAQAGKVIFDYDNSSNGAKDYAALAKELVPSLKDTPIKLEGLQVDSSLLPTLFRVYAPEASSVYLVGDFNDWIADARAAMKKLDNGTWVKVIPLTEGAHSYKFVVDDKWIIDPANNLTENDNVGGRNSLIMVKNS